MRDPNRLDDFYNELCWMHKHYFPDLRFGQLFYNFVHWLRNVKKIDFFFPEEDEMLNYLNEYAIENYIAVKE